MPRKTRPHELADRAAFQASMRPRPDAAENTRIACTTRRSARCFNEAAARCRGKLGAPAAASEGGALASMRPRPDAAENVDEAGAMFGAGCYASMRPRPDAAENICMLDAAGGTFELQ